MILHLISYNIQRAVSKDAIISSFRSRNEFRNASIIAIQEASLTEHSGNVLKTLCESLGKEFNWDYKLVMSYANKEYGNGFIYPRSWQKIEEKVIVFSQIEQLTFLEKLKTEGGTPDTKSAFVQVFKHENVFVRVSNVHMDFVGGAAHRQIQLGQLITALNDQSSWSHDYKRLNTFIDVICGDFNTIGSYKPLRVREKTQKVLDVAVSQGFIDCTANVPWTYDLFANIDPADPTSAFLKLGQKLGGHFRQKTDHLLAKGNFRILQNKTICTESDSHLSGSDHVPLYIELEVQ